MKKKISNVYNSFFNLIVMKKCLYLALAAITFAACTNDADYSLSEQGNPDNAIGFQVMGRNTITRATSLNQAGHYNFGVFGYKSTDQVNPIMGNYLVGYFDNDKGYKQTGSTFGDQPGVADGQSYWMYDGMGKDQYSGTYAGGTPDRFYLSNNPLQYVKYWDKSAATTCFYAYAPYVGSDTPGERVTYVDGTKQSATGEDTYVMNFPNGTIEAGYDDASKYEFMYASTTVSSGDYGHDVSLDFKRLVAKVNIKFWEEVPGYKVRILDLKEGTYKGVQAAASIKEDGQGQYGYKGGKYYTSNGAKIQFVNGAQSGSIKQYDGATATNAVPLVFDAPTAAKIGENRPEASASATTYYAIPKGAAANVLSDDDYYSATGAAPDADLALTGFTFHVTYELTAEDTGEHIIVKNATVHVPYNYCNWDMNKHYTYIFKITSNSNGSTEPNPSIDPTDPEVPTIETLYPIVFDNCTIQDWIEDESEWNITDETVGSYHNITLSSYSLVSGDVEIDISDGDLHNGHAIDWTKVSVTCPDGTSTLTVNDPDGTIHTKHYVTVATGSAAGTYTVKYDCSGVDINGNHPSTWKAYFVVGNTYTINTHHNIIGCNGNETSAKLNITATKDGSGYTPTTTDLKIEYPSNFTDAQKQYVVINGTDVEVKKEAVPGVYKVVLTIDEGSAVKVAEKTFTVKDFNFEINPNVVYNNGAATTITCSQWNSEVTDKEYTSTLGTVTNNTISVPNNSAEDTYTITYTVWNDAAKVTYNKTFEVRNTHSVTVGTQLQRSVGTSNSNDYSTAPIDITTTVNGVATTADLSGSLSIVKADKTTATNSGDFMITYSSGNTYKLTCKAGVPTGTYYVKFTSTVGGASVDVFDDFVVIE